MTNFPREEKQTSDPEKDLRTPWQFSIANLFLVTFLAAVCAAPWYYDPLMGGWVTWFVVTASITVWRTRASMAQQHTELPRRLPRTAAITGAFAVSGLVVVAANVMFCAVCTPVTFVTLTLSNTDFNGPMFTLSVAAGIILGLLTAIAFLWSFWPGRGKRIRPQ